MYQMLVQIRKNSSMMSAAVFLFPPLAHSATLVIDGVNRLATSAYKPPHLGKSLLLGLSRCGGQTLSARS